MSFTATDSLSGIDRYEASIDGGPRQEVTSPWILPALADGSHEVAVFALNKAGLTTQALAVAKIDTTPPAAPVPFAGQSGDDGITLNWVCPAEDVTGYRLQRTPAWPDGERTAEGLSLRDSRLTPGDVYSYKLVAIDHAGLISPAAVSGEIMVGIAVADYLPADGALVDSEEVRLCIESGSLPENVKQVVVCKVESADLEALARYPLIGEIRQVTKTVPAHSIQIAHHD